MDFTFSEKTVRELNRMMFTLYKFFSETISGLESESDDWNNLREIDYKNRSWLYYQYKQKDVSISIHKNRDDTFSLDCENIILTKVPPKYPKKCHDYRYRNFFGSYDNLSSAVIAWKKAVKSFLANELGEFF